ncbi:hypothetical protein [Variovorax sp. JS1663]|uniref:hypothetical protein n=1 Tax=Variovorax sp. JS1663 TaxID=1851577 RepID=UPI00117CA7AF|nr:hypothetical protein [Variovorax sp. JS1663]
MSSLVQKSAQFFLDGVTGGARSITGVTANNTVAVVVELCSQPNTSPTPAINTPTGGWSVAIAPTGSTGVSAYRPNCAVFYKPASSVAAGTHTATWATGQFPTDTYAEVTLLEISGLDASAPVDVVASAAIASAAGSGNAGTTAASSSLGGFHVAAGSCGGEGSSLAGPTSGYTQIDIEPNASTHFTYGSGYKVLTGSGTQTASFTFTGTVSGFVGVQVAFKNASGGGGSSADMTAAAGTATTSTMTAQSGAASAMTGAAGVATASSMAGRATAMASMTAAAGAATAGTLTAVAATRSTMVPAAGQATTSTMTTGGQPQPAPGGMGFEMVGGVREVSFKPLLQRVLDARAERRVKPAKERAQKRAKAFEVEAARLVLEDDGAEMRFRDLMAGWLAQRPVLPPMFDRLDPMQLFMAQVAFRIQQMQAEEQARARLADQDEEEALLALLLA